MELNFASISIIKNITNTVEKCNKDYKDNELTDIKNFLYLFYQNIYNCYKYVKKNFKYVKKEIIRDTYFDKNNKPSLWNSSFFPENIKKFIINQKCSIVYYVINLDSRTFSLYFYFYEMDKLIDKIDDYAKNIYIWLCFANEYLSDSCYKNTNIYIYLTPFNKKYPNNKKVLEVENVNTAFTISGCNENGEIIIFRKEEWFKVLIHETFHSFDLDFSLANIEKLKYKLRKQFNIDSNLLIYESYCEVWARIMNSLISAFSCLDNKRDIGKYLEYSNVFLEFERIYSIRQMNNVLNYMNISYRDILIRKNNNYKEESNVFCYYIIGGILMSNYYKFMKWCYRNNEYFIKFSKNSEKISEYGNLIIEIGIKGEFFDEIKCVNNDNSGSLRMTCIEL